MMHAIAIRVLLMSIAFEIDEEFDFLSDFCQGDGNDERECSDRKKHSLV